MADGILVENPIQIKERLPVIVGPAYEARETFRKKLNPLLKEKEDLSQLFGFTVTTERYLQRVYASFKQDPQRQEFFKVLPTQVEGETVFPEVLDYSQALDFLKADHGYFFGVLDNYDFADAQTRKKLEITIAQATAKYIRSKQGLTTVTINLENEAVAKISSELIAHTNNFTSLKGEKEIDLTAKALSDKAWLDCQSIIQSRRRKTETQAGIYLADLEVAKQYLHDWIRKTQREALLGRKVFATPYYQDLMDYCHRLGDKENGIGGKIYYGPPGTGKTEMAIEVNQREGYKSRVVSVHYWTSFSQLFGEAALEIKNQAGFQASPKERLHTTLDFLKRLQDQGESGVDEFWQMVQRAAEKYGDKGTTALDFLRGLDLQTEGEAIIKPNDNSADLEGGQKAALLRSYIADLGAKVIAVDQGKLKTEEVDDVSGWVKGEILLAIENGERVILDEVDKGASHSLDSLSYLLATSPGKDFTIRDLTVKLPSWFRIDATANVLAFNDPQKQYFYDRFNRVFVDYPPAKDEMMLAGVWLADEDGNLNLPEYRQYQLVAFFDLLLPRIRQLYKDEKLAQPASLRAVKEFCNMLVTPKTGRDKGISLETAIDQLFLGQRDLAADAKQRAALKAVLDQFRSIFKPLVREENFTVEEKMEEETSGKDLRKERTDFIKERLVGISQSPLFKAIVRLPELFSGQISDLYRTGDLTVSTSLVSERKEEIGRLLRQEKPEPLFDYLMTLERDSPKKVKAQLLASLVSGVSGLEESVLLDFAIPEAEFPA